MPIATVNPATGETIETFEPLDARQVDKCLARAEAAFRHYRLTSFPQRSAWLKEAADVLAGEARELARTIAVEMGKPVTQAEAEIAKSVRAMRWYADHAPALLADEPADADEVGATVALVRYRPMGPVLAVMPWNFPVWQVVRFAAPALMAGNVGLLKHASNVPRTALYLGELFERAGFPPGCFQTLLVGSGQIEGVLRDPRVAAATLTGSEPAGRSVAAIAGDEVKKTVLELGGSDPYLVLPSADVDRAARVAVTSRTQNTGQSCIAAKRFIVHADVHDAFLERFTAGMRALTVGDPLDEATEVGPLSSERGLTDLAAMVDDAVARGARVECGGRRPDRPGWFYEPTVLTGVTEEMRVFREETFGPVASVFRVADIEEAIGLANATSFGLSSNAWTRDQQEQERLLRDLESGSVFINGMTASHPALPFGGVKRSGYGRELAGHGIREFCNTTTVWIGS
ncbi:NADP-dependent succinic semialdehyde dehydrogenase [Allostreptomyces psammosilenae]|uniref:Succinate-semialdehyde dehydrogenase/glutarate-semialdehyde dehydrogenase n=1 Tax=Allostreptomyces psammosilenae TaxID=1892865 RepID=A0A853A7Z9_9ACTN|nr:NADP-dependent succinic semialdehyde dehydrogenase [Allostreptomyces psammosilenae]NYI06781.1 succinate-semialdehyde dehydrogenase/glutarate-semialdehyde dehydrogenase [Allostreptomyces psammosilenae]